MESTSDMVSLPRACSQGDFELLGVLLRDGADANEPDSKGRTGLHLAAMRGRDEVMKMLLENGADVGAQDSLGNTPLHYCGHVETIQVLMDYGADMTAKNKHGDRPLKLMKRRGVEEDAIKLLQELENDDNSSIDESLQPLLKRQRNRMRILRERGMSRIKNIWYEFCVDLGAERLVIVLLVVLCLSLYVAYAVTGLAKRIDTRIPIEVGSHKVEL